MLQVWSRVAHVRASVDGGRLDLYALTRAGTATPLLVVEAYDADTLVAGGEVAVWELNQAIAALLSTTIQARRLTLRDEERRHGGHLDVVVGETVQVVASGRDRRVELPTNRAALVADLNALVRHYLSLHRGAAPRTIVLPGAFQPAESAESAPSAASKVS